MGFVMWRQRVGRVRVEVACGPARWERWVTFMAYGRPHAVVVDKRDVDGNALWVYVVEERGEQTVIEIPLSDFARYRITVPTSSVERPPSDGCVLLGLLVAMVGLAIWLLRG
jgi:hypothetical protein